MKKVIIAGGRNFTNYTFLKDTLLAHLDLAEDVEIISGGAKGVDAMGEQFAKEHNIPVRIFPANWEKHKRAAGPIRNREMAEYADVLIAFWDGKSPGTKSMIELAKKQAIEVNTILIST